MAWWDRLWLVVVVVGHPKPVGGRRRLRTSASGFPLPSFALVLRATSHALSSTSFPFPFPPPVVPSLPSSDRVAP